MYTNSHIKKFLTALWLVGSVLLGSYNIISNCVSCTEENNPQKTSTEANAEQKLQGEVEVSFKIGLDGKADILSIVSENPALVDYVKNKLKKIQLQKGDINIDEIITYRFVFKDEV